ncbi:MAG TPA: sodium:proton antiporter [Eubacteriaceae bacterium]|nr:sodium:proton antiporter [Eubacteriaceae bacterium]
MNLINGETISIILFFIGVYGLIAKRNIVKSIMSVGIMQVAVILYFISANHHPEAIPPIGDVSEAAYVADPLPQALMITDIVIGVGVVAASLTMFIHLYHRYGTASWEKSKAKRSK